MPAYAPPHILAGIFERRLFGTAQGSAAPKAALLMLRCPPGCYARMPLDFQTGLCDRNAGIVNGRMGFSTSLAANALK